MGRDLKTSTSHSLPAMSSFGRTSEATSVDEGPVWAALSCKGPGLDGTVAAPFGWVVAWIGGGGFGVWIGWGGLGVSLIGWGGFGVCVSFLPCVVLLPCDQSP